MELVGSNHASISGYATVTGVNSKKALGKNTMLIATIATNEFSMVVPTANLVSEFNPVFRTGAEGCNVQFSYVYGLNGGQIQLNEFTVDGVEYNTSDNAFLTVYVMN